MYHQINRPLMTQNLGMCRHESSMGFFHESIIDKFNELVGSKISTKIGDQLEEARDKLRQQAIDKGIDITSGAVAKILNLNDPAKFAAAQAQLSTLAASAAGAGAQAAQKTVMKQMTVYFDKYKTPIIVGGSIIGILSVMLIVKKLRK